MKKIICFLLIVQLHNNHLFAQNIIQADRLLELIGKPISDPLCQQFRQQEGFAATSDFWNKDFSIYTDNDFSQDKKITLLQFLNGQKRFQSEARYGYYRKELPMKLSWSMSRGACEVKLGYPVKTWPSSPTVFDYSYYGWMIRIEYENNLPVMINFQKDRDYVPMSSTAPLRVDTVKCTAETNWPAIKKLITSCSRLKSFTGKDSVNYYGEVYYETPYKVENFLRTAIKHVRKSDEWYYEAYVKQGIDSMKVRRIFVSLFEEITQALKDSTADDFLIASVAKDPISKSPMNWLVSWSLSPVYKVLPPGLGKVKITLMLSGMKDSFKNDAMDYTLKIYIANHDVKFDFYGWDTPK